MNIQLGREIYGGKRIVVLGMAKSGVAAAKLLLQFGAQIVVNDLKTEEQCNDIVELRERGAKVICGYHPDNLVHNGIDLVVKNPGVPYHAAPVKRALDQGIPVITEVEIAYHISRAPIIGITGSNGKTTTTTLVGEMLKNSGLKAKVAGNIGTVLSEVALETREDEWLVAELSSFQLAGTREFKPKISSILNLYPAHLDYHGTIEDYLESKLKLLENQRKDDIAVFNYDSPILRDLTDRCSAQIIWFSLSSEVENGFFIQDEEIVYKDKDAIVHRVMPLSGVALPGKHNLENVLAACSISVAAGASLSILAETLQSFQGVEHRLELVDKINGVRYYNDSKATNENAAVSALQSFDAPIIHIAGGLDRGVDFEALRPVFESKKIKALIAYGESSEKIQKIAFESGLTQVIPVDNVEKAVLAAYEISVSGDVVLLSPACASWDLYSTFEERGIIFKKSVHNLKNK